MNSRDDLSGTSTCGLRGRVALVTGAGSGIGRAVALHLAREGAAVAVADRDGDRAAGVRREIIEAGGAALALPGDVSRRGDVRGWIDALHDRHGRADILVNNAGLQHVAPVHEFEEDRWDELLGVMLTGAFLAIRYALPGMLAAGWGRVVNVGSIHSLVASKYKSAYVAAKHGLLGLTKTVALETAGSGVTVNCVCPSYVRTPLVEGQVAAQAQAHGISEEEVVQRIMLPACPLGRLLEPEEVARAVGYLCSDAAAGITGAAFTMDGGWTAQ